MIYLFIMSRVVQYKDETQEVEHAPFEKASWDITK